MGAGIPRFAITNTGNVGIGTQNPTQKLEVNGGMRIENDISKPNNGSGITWGYNYSKIKDDGDLNILTDDRLYIGKCDGAGTRTASTIFADVRSGNVGIGTESPIAKLMVNGSGGGTIDFQTTGRMKILSANAGTWLADQHNNDKALYGYETTIPNHAFGILTPRVGWSAFNILQNGNVGIGTTAPNAPLQFGNGVTNRKIVLYDTNNNDNQFYGFGVNGHTLRYQVDGTFSDHVFFAGNGATNSNELMRIKGNGNVGIGTSNPTAKLMVNGSGGQTVDFETTGRMRIVATHPGTWLADQYNTNKAFYGYNSFTLNHAFGIWTPHVGFSAFNILQNGNVGIGTESPTQKLEVNGGMRIENDISKPNNGSGITWGYNYSKIKDDGDLNILTDDRLYIGRCDGAGTRTASTIFADVISGNVGIGTESPTQKLEVNGIGRFSSGLKLSSSSSLEFGEGLTKEINAGKICYGCFDNGQSLNIVGAGSMGNNRKVTMWGEGGFELIGNMGIGRPAESNIKLAVKGSFNVTNSSNKVLFHVSSSGKELVFVGTDAHAKYQSKTESGAINANLFSLWVSKGVVANDFAMSDITAWNDFVFDTEYKLPTLSETANYISKNKHLPYIPSEKEVIEKGYSVHKLNRGFLQTIEEMTLHAIAQEKTIATQEQKMNAQEAKLINLSQELAEIKALLQNKK